MFVGDACKLTTLGTRFSATMTRNLSFRERVWLVTISRTPSRAGDYGRQSSGHYKTTIVHPFVKTNMEQDDYTMGMH